MATPHDLNDAIHFGGQTESGSGYGLAQRQWAGARPLLGSAGAAGQHPAAVALIRTSGHCVTS